MIYNLTQDTMSAENPTEKRKKKPNFTQNENDMLVESVDQNKDIINSKLNNNVTNLTKKKMWKCIAKKSIRSMPTCRGQSIIIFQICCFLC